MEYTEWMAKNDTPKTPDRVRAGKALTRAIDSAIDRGLVSTYSDIASAMGFDRTMIPQHKSGNKPMNREVVLNYAHILQCDPDTIADDRVRMELSRDLERYNSDQAQYAVIREWGPTHKTPIKLPRDLLAADSVDPENLLTVRLHSNGILYSDVALVLAYPDVPIKSGAMHIISLHDELILASIVESNDGYIVTPERQQPQFISRNGLSGGSVVVIGQLYRRIS
jgi:hypothetical protein